MNMVISSKSFIYILAAFFIIFGVAMFYTEKKFVIPTNPVTVTHSTVPFRNHVVFSIAAGAQLWDNRKKYIKLWFKNLNLRGIVWFNKLPNTPQEELKDLPLLKLSNISGGMGWGAQQVRMALMVTDAFRLHLPDVHWFVMGDDDTFFFPENVFRILSKYDHNKMYYIGGLSESHPQNMRFSTNMGYGGAGYAISYPLAKELEKIHNSCVRRYKYLGTCDAMNEACIAEVGITLTFEPGFHQMDIHGDPSGLLTGHPLVPIATIHHMGWFKPIFPGMNTLEALTHLSNASNLDQAALLQQSFCYYKNKLSIKVSWGYAVQLTRRYIAPRDFELPVRTFTGLNGEKNNVGFYFKSWAVTKDPCLTYESFFMTEVAADEPGFTYSRYSRSRPSACTNQDYVSNITTIEVIKEITDDPAYRRQCCRIRKLSGESMHLLLADCKAGEFSI